MCSARLQAGISSHRKYGIAERYHSECGRRSAIVEPVSYRTTPERGLDADA
jgi:hypothetical protein